MTRKNDRIIKAFYRIYDAMRDKAFTKSRKITEYNEKELLIPVRFYLLGEFGNVTPECQSYTDPGQSIHKRIDFVINEKIAVEFAVRSKNDGPGKVAAKTNETEIKKLIRWTKGPAILVLFDFSGSPLPIEVLHKFKLPPTLGSGNHKKSSYWVIYYWYDYSAGESRHIQIGTQVKRKK